MNIVEKMLSAKPPQFDAKYEATALSHFGDVVVMLAWFIRCGIALYWEYLKLKRYSKLRRV